MKPYERQHGVLSCPGRAATPLAFAAQSRDPEVTQRITATWAPALQRIVEETLRCVRGTLRKSTLHRRAVIDVATARSSLTNSAIAGLRLSPLRNATKIRRVMIGRISLRRSVPI